LKITPLCPAEYDEEADSSVALISNIFAEIALLLTTSIKSEFSLFSNSDGTFI